MRGATLCSGIGAPECAALDIDWIWSSDIEPFPNAVRAVRYPDSINLGDMTAEDFIERAAAIGLPDVLVAGTPCQAFSVAGLRRSLSDDRGNLTLLFVRICDAIDDLRRAAGLDPLWVVWENVPGVLSTSDNAFGSFLAGLGGHDAPIVPARGHRWSNSGVVAGPKRNIAWRVLDAQYFGVPQRRRRVFAIARGGAGNWHGADALLPITESLQWHPAPRRKAGTVAPTIPARSTGGGGLGTDFDLNGGLINDRVTPTLDANMDKKWGSNQWVDSGSEIMSSGQSNAEIFTDGSAPSLTCLHEAPIVTHALTTQCSWATEDGTGRGSPLVPVCVEVADTLGVGANQTTGFQSEVVATYAPVAFDWKAAKAQSLAITEDMTPTIGTETYAVYAEPVARSLTARHDGSPCDDRGPNIVARSAVRRLTPRECERLQGFPDDWTAITVKNKPAADTPRYKALGNSMAVPVMKYILDRIKLVNEGT